MKHLVMIANDTNFAYNLRKEVLEGFLSEGWKVTLVTEILNYEAELSALGCQVVAVTTGRHGTSMLQDGKLFARYLSILRELKPDLVLTNNIKPNVYGGMACRLLGIRYMPNITGLGTPVENPGLLQKITIPLYRMGVAGAEAVFFQNSDNAEFFRKHRMLSRKSKAVLLPGSGVNLQRYPLMPYPPAEKTHFLFAARVMKEKGIDLFLAAARKFHNEDTIFEVVGMCDDDHYSSVLADAHNAGVICYHGLQKDMTPFYTRCSCFLYPSYYPEGMSNVLLEAAATGRPVIAADRSGCRETVEHGVNGYVVPVNDEEATLRAVERFLQLPYEARKAMGLAGHTKMQQEFDRNQVVRMYIDTVG